MLFSIIIPIYNREATLPKCLDSILAQDIADYECILVNDGSVDNSLKVCQEYSLKDARFKVFDKANGGVGSARNLGLEKANGDWIVFIDSDDRVLPDHLSQFEAQFSEDVDIVFCGIQYEGAQKHPNHTYEKNTYIGKESLKNFFAETDALQYMCACDRTYRKLLLDKHAIRFDTTLPISEDRLFCYEVLKYVKGVATAAKATYVINESDSNSLSRRPLSSEVCVDRFHKLSVGMIELVEKYEIYDDAVLPFWTYNFDLLKFALLSFYNVKGSIFSAVKKQRKFMEKYFDYTFYRKISKVPEIKAYMSNKQYQWMLTKQFYKLDLHILLGFVLYKLHISR